MWESVTALGDVQNTRMLQRAGAADARAAMEISYNDLDNGTGKYHGAKRWEIALGEDFALMDRVKAAIGVVDKNEGAERVQQLYHSLS